MLYKLELNFISEIQAYLSRSSRWMSPAECLCLAVRHQTPNQSSTLKWRCKAYVLVFKADRRKDWGDKAMVVYFMGYSKCKEGALMLLGDTVVLRVCKYCS